MKFSINKILLILVVLVVIVVVGVWALMKNVPEESSLPETEGNIEEGIGEGVEEGQFTGYPDNLLEGVIVDIDSSSFIIKADISEIEGMEGKEKMEKTIEVSEDTEIIIYNLLTQETESISLGDLEFGDNVVVVTKESTYSDILTREKFIAIKVSKMISPFQPSQ